MQDPKTTSTLELVVNEQQLQNMSQIDLSRPEENNQTQTNQQQQQPQQHQQQASNQIFGLQNLREWPGRVRESFNAKIDEAKSKSDTKTQFVIQLLNGYSATLLWSICFLCTTAVPLILFFIGLLNLDNCSDRPSLPYLVFAFGFVMTASNFFNLALTFDLPILRNHEILTKDIKNTIASIINIIFVCVVVFLYILCGYMVFTIGNKTSKDLQNNSNENLAEHRSIDEASVATGDLDPNLSKSIDCGSTLYHTTYWFITLTLGLIAILILASIILYTYNRYRLAIVRGSTPRSQTTNTNNNLSTTYASNGV